MGKKSKKTISWLLVTVIVCSSVLFGQGKKASDSPAPIPTKIAAARTAFISYAAFNNAALAKAIPKLSGTPNGYYDQFYAAMKGWGRYELVSDPTEADLVLEISATWEPSIANPQLILRVLDPKTKVILWAFVEETQTTPKEWNKALGKLVSDMQAITSPAPGPVANQK